MSMIIADTGGIYKRKPLHLIRRCMGLFPSSNGHFPFNKDRIPVSGSGRFPQNGNVTKWSAGNAPISHLALEFIGLHHKSACNFETCRYNNSRCVWKAPNEGRSREEYISCPKSQRLHPGRLYLWKQHESSKSRPFQSGFPAKDKLLYRLRKRPDHWINKGRTAFCPIINNTIQGGFVQQVQLLFYCENGVLKRWKN